jgi:ribonucleoside-diphosphate reductase alpha chain
MDVLLPNAQILGRFTGAGETWQSLVERVSSVGDRATWGQYRQLIAEGAFVPGGQILRGLGRINAVLYNCFVTGVEAQDTPDTLAARMSAWTRLGAGVGVNLDSLVGRKRRKGTSACDIISVIAKSQHELWMEGIKRTATMVTLSMNDPEVVAASYLLTSGEPFRHLNLGVLIHDDDMQTKGTILSSLAETAWATGNPGFIFIDRVRRDHPFNDTVYACNPCGEQFLADDEGCNLGSLNLAAFVSRKQIDWSAFTQAVGLAVRFLDDVIDASAFPSLKTAEMAKRRRRIGLGVLGFASALHQLDVKYGSAESVHLAEEWAVALRRAAETASMDLAIERGAFPESADGRLRNSHLLSIAPTGAISLLWNVSSGIEPFFGESIRKGAIRINSATALCSRLAIICLSSPGLMARVSPT